MTSIHDTAIIEDGAEIGAGTTVGAYSIIRSNVKIGENSKIGPHVVIEGHTEIGNENKIFQFASIGAEPQDLKFKGEASKLIIGNNNIIREYVTLQPGTEGGGMLTQVGNQNLFMASTHLGHDSRVGNKCIFANAATIAGHVTIEDKVFIGGLAAVHQYVKVGELSMIAAGAMTSQDVPSYCMVQGDRAQIIGIHQTGLERNGFSVEDIRSLKNTYKDLFLKPGLLSKKLNTLAADESQSKFSKIMLNFIKNSERGICSLRKQ